VERGREFFVAHDQQRPVAHLPFFRFHGVAQPFVERGVFVGEHFLAKLPVHRQRLLNARRYISRPPVPFLPSRFARPRAVRTSSLSAREYFADDSITRAIVFAFKNKSRAKTMLPNTVGMPMIDCGDDDTNVCDSFGRTR